MRGIESGSKDLKEKTGGCKVKGKKREDGGGRRIEGGCMDERGGREKVRARS